MLRSYVRLFRGASPYLSLCQIRPLYVTFPPGTREQHTTGHGDEAGPEKRKRGRPRKSHPPTTVEKSGKTTSDTPNSTSKSQPSTPPETEHTIQTNPEGGPATRKLGHPAG